MEILYRRILLPLDGSDVARSALATAVGISRLLDTRLTLMSVLQEGSTSARPVGATHGAGSDGSADIEPDAESLAAAYLDAIATELQQLGVQTDSTVVTNPDAASEIVLTARDRDAQLIVMASRGRSGIVRGLLGSVTDRVIHSSPIPVMVVPADDDSDVARWTPRSIIVPLDGSELAESALPHAEMMAGVANIPIILVRSVPFPITYGADMYAGMSTAMIASAEEDEKIARQYLAEVATRLRAHGHHVETHMSAGHPRTEIAAVAQETEDSIVIMTTRGASGLTRWVVGSVADSVIRSSGVPVLIIPPGTGI